MKKVKFKAANAASLQAAKKKIQNSLSDVSEELKEALLTVIETLESDEHEYDIDEFKSAVEEIVAKYDNVPEATANAIAKAVESTMARVQNALPNNEKLTQPVRNQIAAAIFRSHDKDDAKLAVNAVLTKNGITGLEFNEVVDYVVDWKVEDLNPLFKKLHRTMVSKFFYGEISLAVADNIAKGWLKTNEGEKAIQQLEAKGKSFTTDYVYKRQQVSFKDRDEIEQAGQLANFLNMVSKELDLMIVNACVNAILVGDNVNSEQDKVHTFETIGTKTETDAFTTVVNVNDAELLAYLTSVTETDTPQRSKLLAAARYTRDQIFNPSGKEVVAVMSRQALSLFSPHVVAAGGDLIFRTKEEVAAQLGVDDIYLTDVMPSQVDAEGALVIFMIPDGYWYKEVKSIDVAYPTYEKNVYNLQKERNIGGAIHDLASTAILRGQVESAE